jgi:hypothetical protein
MMRWAEEKWSDELLASDDRRDRETAIKVCGQHLQDLRRMIGTPLRSLRLMGEEDSKPLIR